MSAKKITTELLKDLKSKKPHDFILLNFANCDLVGHSGDFKATVKAVETLDGCLKRIVPLALKKDYKILITADHGNADVMKYPNGEDCPAHSLNKVMFMLVSDKGKTIPLRTCNQVGLKNIAPTVLELMEIKKPEVMSRSIIKKRK